MRHCGRLTNSQEPFSSPVDKSRKPTQQQESRPHMNHELPGIHIQEQRVFLPNEQFQEQSARAPAEWEILETAAVSARCHCSRSLCMTPSAGDKVQQYGLTKTVARPSPVHRTKSLNSEGIERSKKISSVCTSYTLHTSDPGSTDDERDRTMSDSQPA